MLVAEVQAKLVEQLSQEKQKRRSSLVTALELTDIQLLNHVDASVPVRGLNKALQSSLSILTERQQLTLPKLVRI